VQTGIFSSRNRNDDPLPWRCHCFGNKFEAILRQLLWTLRRISINNTKMCYKASKRLIVLKNLAGWIFSSPPTSISKVSHAHFTTSRRMALSSLRWVLLGKKQRKLKRHISVLLIRWKRNLSLDKQREIRIIRFWCSMIRLIINHNYWLSVAWLILGRGEMFFRPSRRRCFGWVQKIQAGLGVLPQFLLDLAE